MILNQPVFTLISPTRHSILSWFWTNLSLPWFHRHDTPHYHDSEPTSLYLDFTDTTLHIIMILNQPVFTLISPTRHSILSWFWTNQSLPWFHRHDTPHYHDSEPISLYLDFTDTTLHIIMILNQPVFTLIPPTRHSILSWFWTNLSLPWFHRHDTPHYHDSEPTSLYLDSTDTTLHIIMILNQPVFTLIPPTRHSILSWFWTDLSLPWFHRHDTPHYHDSEPTSLYLDSTDTTLHIIMILNQPVFTLVSPTRHSTLSWFWTNQSLPWFHRHDTPYYHDSEPTCLYLDFTDTTLHSIMILNQPVFTLISPTRHSILLWFWTNLSLPWFHRHDTPHYYDSEPTCLYLDFTDTTLHIIMILNQPVFTLIPPTRHSILSWFWTNLSLPWFHRHDTPYYHDSEPTCLYLDFTDTTLHIIMILNQPVFTLISPTRHSTLLWFWTNLSLPWFHRHDTPYYYDSEPTCLYLDFTDTTLHIIMILNQPVFTLISPTRHSILLWFWTNLSLPWFHRHDTPHYHDSEPTCLYLDFTDTTLHIIMILNQPVFTLISPTRHSTLLWFWTNLSLPWFHRHDTPHYYDSEPTCLYLDFTDTPLHIIMILNQPVFTLISPTRHSTLLWFWTNLSLPWFHRHDTPHYYDSEPTCLYLDFTDTTLHIIMILNQPVFTFIPPTRHSTLLWFWTNLSLPWFHRHDTPQYYDSEPTCLYLDFTDTTLHIIMILNQPVFTLISPTRHSTLLWFWTNLSLPWFHRHDTPYYHDSEPTCLYLDFTDTTLHIIMILNQPVFTLISPTRHSTLLWFWTNLSLPWFHRHDTPHYYDSEPTSLYLDFTDTTLHIIMILNQPVFTLISPTRHSTLSWFWTNLYLPWFHRHDTPHYYDSEPTCLYLDFTDTTLHIIMILNQPVFTLIPPTRHSTLLWFWTNLSLPWFHRHDTPYYHDSEPTCLYLDFTDTTLHIIMILNQPVFTLISPTRHSILLWFWTNLSLPWFHRHDTPYYHDSEPTCLYLDFTDTTLHIIMILNQPVFTLISPTRHSIFSWFWTNLSLPWFHRHDTPHYYDSEPTCLYLDFTDTTLHIIMILNQPVFTLISPTRHSILSWFWTNLSLPWFHRHDTPHYYDSEPTCLYLDFTDTTLHIIMILNQPVFTLISPTRHSILSWFWTNLSLPWFHRHDTPHYYDSEPTCLYLDFTDTTLHIIMILNQPVFTLISPTRHSNLSWFWTNQSLILLFNRFDFDFWCLTPL